MKSNNYNILLTILVILNLCITGILGFYVYHTNKTSSGNAEEQYVMYIGTNDKDTYSQLITTEEAKSIIDHICFKYVEGYTIQDATGSWVDEKGASTHENTIVCYFDGTDEETVYKIADEVLKELNQNTVLIEKDEIQIDFYSGR